VAKLTDRDKEALVLEALEVNEDGKKKFTQQQLADKYEISKGMVNRYVQEKNSKSKQIIDDEVRILGELEILKNEKSKHLSKQEQIEVNKQVQDKFNHLQKTNQITSNFQDAIIKRQNATAKLIDVIDKHMERQLQEAKTQEDIEKLYDSYNVKMEMIINYGEIKAGSEASDKLAITSGVAQRHASSQVNIENNNTNQVAVQPFSSLYTSKE